MNDSVPQPQPSVDRLTVPTQAASQIALSMNINEIAILFGQLRQIVDPVTNNLSTQPAIEWLVSLSLPLPAAKNLVAGLKHTIEVYESRFGAIPSDPNQTQQIST